MKDKEDRKKENIYKYIDNKNQLKRRKKASQKRKVEK